MKKIISLFVMVWSVCVFAQHGINTTNPITTLEIKAASDGSTKAEGLLIPTLTDAQIQVMPVTSAHAGMLIYNSTKDCVQSYTASQWKCIGSGAGNGLNAYLNATYAGSTGTWVQNYSANGNTISFQISNNSNMSFSQLNLNSALQLTNASAGLSYTPASDYSNVTIGSGTVATFTYNITGTPTTAGTLTANFNASGGISAYGNITITPQSAVQAISISFAGTYVSNKQLDAADHSVQLTVKNNSLNPLSNADLSNAVALSGISGFTVLPGQNTSVNIPAGQTAVLTYKLQGLATAPGTLTATFTPTQQVSGSATATQSVPLFGNVANSNLVINGSYVYGQVMNPGNTVTVTVTNNNGYNLQQINLSQALTLSGAVNNINVAANQNTAVTIPANSSVTLTYNLNGTSLVQGGGTLTATFAQAPFATLTATKNVVGNNNFYATPNAATLPSAGGSYTFNITSSLPWNATLTGDAANWMTISGTTGTNGNGTITISTQAKTSQYAQIGYITVTRPSDGASIQIAVNQAPTDNFQITGFTSQVGNFTFGDYGDIEQSYYLSIHENKTSTITTNQNNLQLYGSLPDFVKNIAINGNQIVITPKEKTNSDKPQYGTIRFSYGSGYLSNPITIGQNQKAYKCPLNSPVRADNGYKIWNSSQNFDGSVFNTLVESRTGIDSFSDYSTSGNVDFYSNYGYPVKNIVQNSGNSTLFINIQESDTPFSFSSKDIITWSNPLYYKYVFLYKTNKNIQAFRNDSRPYEQNPDLSNSVTISPVICADGYDEDTPSVTGNAGWRQ